MDKALYSIQTYVEEERLQSSAVVRQEDCDPLPVVVVVNHPIDSEMSQ